ncbi:MAG: hypothetical protein L0H31_06715 [Nocardioidaceae bacterium]|nr:hypothetical protein [Nocardioidaceae bacterium]
MSADDSMPKPSEIDDLAEMRARTPQRPDNKWETPVDEPAEDAPRSREKPAAKRAEESATAPAAGQVETGTDGTGSRVRDEMAAKNSRTREAMAAKGMGDPTQPPALLTAVVSIASYILGVLAGWGAGSWMDADPWPIAFAGVVGGVIGFLLGRGILRGVYALRR